MLAPPLETLSRVDGRKYRRIGVISDSHGAIDTRILASMSKCDAVIHAGDLGGATALEQLGRTGESIVIRGNNDTLEKWGCSDKSRLAVLPDALRIETSDGYIVVIHGHQFPRVATRHKALARLYPGARAIICGHSHRVVIDKETSPWVLNPGACGRSRTFGGPSALILALPKNAWVVSQLRLPPL